jgi:hypothetical protein
LVERASDALPNVARHEDGKEQIHRCRKREEHNDQADPLKAVGQLNVMASKVKDDNGQRAPAVCPVPWARPWTKRPQNEPCDPADEAEDETSQEEQRAREVIVAWSWRVHEGEITIQHPPPERDTQSGKHSGQQTRSFSHL